MIPSSIFNSCCSRLQLHHAVAKLTKISRIPTKSVPKFITQRCMSSASEDNERRPQVCWLNLEGSGLSAVERLCLEEALLRHDPLNRSWAIVGTHYPIYSSRLKLDNHYQEVINGISDTSGNFNNNNTRKLNDNCIIIMGIGGKTDKLLNIDKVKKDGVLVIKRFSGGGTVVVDQSSLWTTFIGRTSDFPDVPPYPKEIMKWSADEIFLDVFERLERSCSADASSMKKRKTMVMDTKSCGLASTFKQKEVPSSTTNNQTNHEKFRFRLRENDYVLGDFKMGGNAQSITSGAWLHHTSFLWDYENDHMEYLTLPDKRPTYRGDRNHDDFLVKLKSVYGEAYSDIEGKRIFFSHIKSASENAFDLIEVQLKDALYVIDNELGGFQNWFQGSSQSREINEMMRLCLSK